MRTTREDLGILTARRQDMGGDIPGERQLSRAIRFGTHAYTPVKESPRKRRAGRKRRRQNVKAGRS